VHPLTDFRLEDAHQRASLGARAALEFSIKERRFESAAAITNRRSLFARYGFVGGLAASGLASWDGPPLASPGFLMPNVFR
jgi:hypothetical protein